MRDRVAEPSVATQPADTLPSDAVAHAEVVDLSQTMAHQRRVTLWRLVIFGVLIAFVAALAFGLMRQSRTSSRPEGVAPDFTVTTFDGETITLSDLRGKGVILNFWASWCIPCRNEAPILEQVWQQEKDNGIVVIGLDYLDQDHKAREFLAEFDVTYPNAVDLQSAAARKYGITGVPETYFIGPDGEIKDMKLFELTSMDEMEGYLAKIRPQQ